MIAEEGADAPPRDSSTGDSVPPKNIPAAGPSRAPWILLSWLSLAALAVSIALYFIQRDIESFTAVCHIAPGFDCAPALKSKYGKIFSIPLSSYAIVTYALFALMGMQAVFGQKRVNWIIQRDRNALALSIMSSFAVVFVLRLAWVSAFKLKAYCPFCLALHILTLLIFFCSLRALSARTSTIREIWMKEYVTIRSDKRLIAGILAAAFVTAVGLPLIQHEARERLLDEQPTYREILDGKYSRYEELDALTKGRPFLGRPDALVTIVEFADYTCPLCAQSRLVIKDLMEVYDIRFILVSYPRSTECNPSAQSDHPGACLAALAGAYASQRGRLWMYAEAVFDDKTLLDPSRVNELAALAGAGSMDEIQRDTAARILLHKDIDMGIRAGVLRVPSFFINGMGVEGKPEDWFFEEAIEREMARVKAQGVTR